MIYIITYISINTFNGMNLKHSYDFKRTLIHTKQVSIGTFQTDKHNLNDLILHFSYVQSQGMWEVKFGKEKRGGNFSYLINQLA